MHACRLMNNIQALIALRMKSSKTDAGAEAYDATSLSDPEVRRQKPIPISHPE